jgi:hypothetical protein
LTFHSPPTDQKGSGSARQESITIRRESYA